MPWPAAPRAGQIWSWPGLPCLLDPSSHKEPHLYTGAHSLHSSPRAGDTDGHTDKQHPGQISHDSEMRMSPFGLWAVKVTNLALRGSYSPHRGTLCRRVHRQGQGPHLAGKVIASCQGEVHSQPPIHSISLVPTTRHPPPATH